MDELCLFPWLTDTSVDGAPRANVCITYCVNIVSNPSLDWGRGDRHQMGCRSLGVSSACSMNLLLLYLSKHDEPWDTNKAENRCCAVKWFFAISYVQSVVFAFGGCPGSVPRLILEFLNKNVL